jgi:UDP-N-acetylmuramate dehydrogenase
MDSLAGRLREIAPVKLNEPLSRHTTFGVGGPADIFVRVTTEDQLRLSYAAAASAGVPVFVFGSGSNVVVGDGGFRGVVIENRYAEMIGPELNGTGYRVRAGSGMSFSTLARRLAGAGYGGVEWACGIPGSLGGAVVTNAGAYGRSLADVIVSARIGDTEGATREISPDGLGLAYRKSALLEGRMGDVIVLSVDLRVQEGNPAELKETIAEFDAQRKAAQPTGRNCGSVFQNPEGKTAWELVDGAGLRGHRIGKACFSELHSNFIQNLGDATAADILALVRLAQERVKERFGVDLQTEVMLIGDFAGDAQ